MSMFTIPEEFMPSVQSGSFPAFDMSKWFDFEAMKLPEFDYASFGMEVPAMPEPAAAAFLPATMASLAPATVYGYWTGLFEAMTGVATHAKPEEKIATKLAKVEKTANPAEETVKKVAEKLDPVPATAVSGEVALARVSLESRPAGLEAPRGGTSDDLKMIAGIGPKIETILHDLGIYHFDQIAAWTAREVEWVDDYLKFSGRIIREDWIAQAAALAKGGRDEYVKVFGKEPR